MKPKATRREASQASLQFLQLNEDSLEHIMYYVSVEDACALRACSKFAAQIATPRAMSRRTVFTSPGVTARIEGILQSAGAGTSPEFAWLVDLTVVPVLGRWESTDAFVSVLIKLLLKAQRIQSFMCRDSHILLENRHGERLRGTISGLRSLQTLALFSSSADTSRRLFFRSGLREDGSLKYLVRLSLGELDLPDLNTSDMLKYEHLHTLTVKTLNGSLSHLVHFAPNLRHLETGSIGAVVHDAVTQRWQSLDIVMGRLCDLHRLLPLFHGPMATRRIVFTNHIVEHEEACVKEVLSATRLCCLEFWGQDYLPIHRSLSSASQRLFYLQVCRPEGEHPWLNDLLAVAKALPRLLCLDINVRDADVPGAFHRFPHHFSCRIPGLRFLILTRQVKMLRDIDPDEDRVKWTHPDVHGVRFVHNQSALDNWARGRYCGALGCAHAQCVRAAYRDASFETRFDVEERLFPGPLPCGPGVGAGGSESLDLPWVTMAHID